MKSDMESNDQAKKEKKKKIEDINADIAKTQAKLDEITPKVRCGCLFYRDKGLLLLLMPV